LAQNSGPDHLPARDQPGYQLIGFDLIEYQNVDCSQAFQKRLAARGELPRARVCRDQRAVFFAPLDDGRKAIRRFVA
jgi:hypothetical protein